MTKAWLAVGSPKNWQRAFESGNLWGLKEPQRNLWETVEKGDRLFIYASSPVQGIVGVGEVVNKLIQTSPLWPEEVEQNKVIYPLLLELDVEYLLPQHDWKVAKLVHDTVKRRVKFRQTFQIIEEALASELLAHLATPTPGAAEKQPSLHEQLVDALAQAGRLQKFIAEKGYNMEGAKLDVVWRRVEKAVPAYVFEVHIGGNLYQALAKLKHAFDIWNSSVFVVVQEKELANVEKLLSGTFHEIRNRLKVMKVPDVEELRTRKEKVHELETELGLV